MEGSFGVSETVIRGCKCRETTEGNEMFIIFGGMETTKCRPKATRRRG